MCCHDALWTQKTCSYFSGDFDMLNETKAVVEVWENFTHFSTFGLSARNGTIRWRHLPGEFGQLLHIKVVFLQYLATLFSSTCFMCPVCS